MTNVDTSNWMEFKISDVFEKVKTDKIDGKANDFLQLRARSM